MEAAGHFYDRVVADQVAYPRVTAWDTVGWERDGEEAVHKAHDSCDRQMLPLCNGSECPVLRSVRSTAVLLQKMSHDIRDAASSLDAWWGTPPSLGWGGAPAPAPGSEGNLGWTILRYGSCSRAPQRIRLRCDFSRSRFLAEQPPLLFPTSLSPLWFLAQGFSSSSFVSSKLEV